MRDLLPLAYITLLHILLDIFFHSLRVDIASEMVEGLVEARVFGGGGEAWNSDNMIIP